MEPVKRVNQRVKLAQLEDLGIPKTPSVPIEAQSNADTADRRQHDGQFVVDHDTGKKLIVKAVDGLALAHVAEGHDAGYLTGAHDSEKADRSGIGRPDNWPHSWTAMTD